jgi:hypothetical protein
VVTGVPYGPPQHTGEKMPTWKEYYNSKTPKDAYGNFEQESDLDKQAEKHTKAADAEEKYRNKSRHRGKQGKIKRSRREYREDTDRFNRK